MSYNTFTITDGKFQNYQLFFDENRRKCYVEKKRGEGGPVAFPVSDITSLELIEGKVVKTGDSVAFGIAGALLGGPLGAAAGASLGGLSRPCTFIIETAEHGVFVCEGWKMHFNKLYKTFRVVHASN